MTHGNNVPQGGDRYEPGFAGWADFAGVQGESPRGLHREARPRHGRVNGPDEDEPPLHASEFLAASMANYAAGFMTKGNTVPQGENRYEPGFAGWADFARGYKASHPADFPG